MRFTDHPDVSDANELRAARGHHALVLEEEDNAPALRMQVPHLGITADGDSFIIDFCSGADISLRFMQLQDPAVCALKYYEYQFNADPLSRSWAVLQPGLNLSTELGARVYSRREFREAQDAVLESLSDDDKDKLAVVASDFMGRLAPLSLDNLPFNTHGGWIKELLYGHLACNGALHAYVDLAFAAVDAHSDAAYATGAKTRTALAEVSALVREMLGTHLVGAELAEEVGRALAGASAPTALLRSAGPPATALARLKSLLRWRLSEGHARAAIEARLLERELPEGADTKDCRAAAALIKGAGAQSPPCRIRQQGLARRTPQLCHRRIAAVPDAESFEQPEPIPHRVHALPRIEWSARS